ncbi:TusE/DsrC/DsvC family sulfur relay protein [Candidatus Formimonas warabiya]|uniref:TusE/DsrC/DsvC family sulfur relay protein n=1 Tax=Formimonas warabiya TaxID=1761012 RepID=A0A3G1KYK4_FORW1|nr:TusE/DsrC/DsvC family sulfur relay protein [Candidatus Formimonas warabiya]ATW27521.1 hypothetical protein DCMF_24670 [Candidatus Formimonas warabiya]
MSRFNILGSQIRRHYLYLGAICVEDEKIWQEMTECILTKEGIDPITPRHREIMAFLRQYYLERQRSPSVREICAQTNSTSGDFFALFSDWPHTLFVINSIVSQVLGIPFWHTEQD